MRAPFAAAPAAPARAALALVAALALSAGCGRPEPRPAHHGADGLVVATSDSAYAGDVLFARRSTVVWYTARGSIPCALIGPHVAKLAQACRGRIVFWKLDVGASGRMQHYGITSVPTLILYRRGAEVARAVGLPLPATDDSLRRFVAPAMGGGR